jgi:hypothetical protein
MTAFGTGAIEAASEIAVDEPTRRSSARVTRDPRSDAVSLAKQCDNGTSRSRVRNYSHRAPTTIDQSWLKQGLA